MFLQRIRDSTLTANLIPLTASICLSHIPRQSTSVSVQRAPWQQERPSPELPAAASSPAPAIVPSLTTPRYASQTPSAFPANGQHGMSVHCLMETPHLSHPLTALNAVIPSSAIHFGWPATHLSFQVTMNRALHTVGGMSHFNRLGCRTKDVSLPAEHSVIQWEKPINPGERPHPKRERVYVPHGIQGRRFYPPMGGKGLSANAQGP